MIVYRGPRQKNFSDDLHARTDEVEISENSQKFVDTIAIQMNVTKEGDLRKAVATILISAKDIADLNAIMYEIQSKKIQTLNGKIESLEKRIRKSVEQENMLRQIKNEVSRIAASSEDPSIHRVRELLGIGKKSLGLKPPPLKRSTSVN